MNNETIRDAVQSRLDTILSIPVYKSRFDPNFFDNLPVVCHYVNETSGADNSTKERQYTVLKTVNIVIEIVVKAYSTWITDADVYLEQIKAGLFQDETFHDLFRSITGYSENYTMYTEAEQPITTAVLTITVLTDETFNYLGSP